MKSRLPLLLVAVGVLLVAPKVGAKLCGDNVDGRDVPCACGDTVVSDLVLNDDPVLDARENGVLPQQARAEPVHGRNVGPLDLQNQIGLIGECFSQLSVELVRRGEVMAEWLLDHHASRCIILCREA